MAACGDDGGPIPIDCSWFEGDNCWKDSVAAAYACVDPNAEGTFHASRGECMYADGTTVTFAQPVPSTGFEDYEWSFSIGPADGEACMSFEDSDALGGSELVLETSEGRFRETANLTATGGTLRFDCPDGTSYQIGVIAALECDLSTVPGHVAVSSGGTVSFNFLGRASTDGDLFSCSDDTQ
ncbi:hypothetical protein [Haliangium sp.]|uniref:hypothetical protein n=1 Tax=Haliangium sp. TaxID=2663208 RepID=UPI003D0D8F62